VQEEGRRKGERNGLSECFHEDETLRRGENGDFFFSTFREH